MKLKKIWMVVVVALLSTVSIDLVYSQSQNDYQWTFEPKVDGSAHVEVAITIGAKYPLFGISVPKTTPMKNIEAREADTGNRIDITETKEGDKIQYILEFEETKSKGFQFIVEYDILKVVQEIYDEVYYFSWKWESEFDSSHTATVILPRNHELLDTDYTEPASVSSHGNQLQVVFTDDASGTEPFHFMVTFSQKGVRLRGEAETYFAQKEYEKAKGLYQEAMTFYLSFPDALPSKVQLMLELGDRVKECENNLAEEKFEEAMAAFNNGDYETAKQLFDKVEDMYVSIDNVEKVNECRDFMDQCTQLMEQELIREEADNLVKEGITYFEQEQYEKAKTTFEAALAKYTELGDEEKIAECQDWIHSCEEELKGFCMGSSLIFIALFSAVFVSVFKSSRNKQ
jgi:tetratricopeptide (TPR) repeat protein